MENLRVIDVSEHQGTINWDAVIVQVQMPEKGENYGKFKSN
nr:MAG TPA: hypothetical protein [Bacteriophage sp.]